MADRENTSRAIEDDDDEFNEHQPQQAAAVTTSQSHHHHHDESLSERLIGLTEMFPESVRRACSATGSFVSSTTKTGFWLVKNILWIASSSAVILILPVVFESERSQQHEEHLQQQRQILLGPNAAVSGGNAGSLLPGMNMIPPSMPQRPS